MADQENQQESNQLNQNSSDVNAFENKSILNSNDMSFLNDVQISITIEVGRSTIKIKDLLNLSKDSIIELNKTSGDPVDIYANGKLIAKGNIISANGKYCVRLMSIVRSEASNSNANI